MKEKYLRNLEARRAEILALEAEVGGTDAELAMLLEQGIETSIKLGEIFARKVRKN
jgi:transcriptional accessory protein Tex/SPT6